MSEQTIVTVNVQGARPIAVPWTNGMNAQQALELAYGTAHLLFGLQYFGSFGYLVFMISQTYDTFNVSVEPYFYWEFFYNNLPASQGIDNTTLLAGDQISFNFVAYNAQQHAGTSLEVKHNVYAARK